MLDKFQILTVGTGYYCPSVLGVWRFGYCYFGLRILPAFTWQKPLDDEGWYIRISHQAFSSFYRLPWMHLYMALEARRQWDCGIYPVFPKPLTRSGL